MNCFNACKQGSRPRAPCPGGGLSGFFPFCGLVFFMAFVLLVSSCAPKKSKTLVDRIYEMDPSGRLFVHPDFEKDPPKTIAVLPFKSLVGEGRIEGSEELLATLWHKQKITPEALASEMRLTFFGQLSRRRYRLLHPEDADEILARHGISGFQEVKATSVLRLGKLLGVDAVVFGYVKNFDYYYAFLYTQLAVGLTLEMYSTKNGELLWRFNDTRRDHTVRVALDPISLAVGLFQAAFSLRGINMTRQMDEICREAVATIPPACPGPAQKLATLPNF
ncbi:MAG: hypothetical protein DRH12_02900 [Deltaproteobacteria bacterium]|nr:MAG: hypothetical protein DRH12_02900 [Deltaproteobacteria bacterium]